MSKKVNKTLIGAFVIGAIGLLVIAVLVLRAGKFFAPTSMYVLFFEGSVKGLNIGSPVMYHGVKMGEVKEIQLRFNPKDLSAVVPVYIVAGFTPLVEKLGSGKAYRLMDQVYEILIHKVHEYEGAVNEMTGDGVMALFGAAIALEDAPQKAIRSALAIHREMAKFSDKLQQEEDSPRFKWRIGIHTEAGCRRFPG